MVTRKVVFVSVVLFSSFGCDGGGDNEGVTPEPRDNPNFENVTPGEQGKQEGVEDEKDGFYLKEVITNQKDEWIPITKIPSMSEDGKWLDTCRKGQIFYEDHCYDSIHLSDKRPGFVLKSSTKTFTMSPIVGSGWTRNFSTRQSYGGDDKFQYKHRITWKCGDFSMGCKIPSGIPEGVITRVVEDKEYIEQLYLEVFFNWGGDIPTASPHTWFVNGTIELKGKTYPLPLTLKALREAYPSYNYGNRIRNSKYTGILFQPMVYEFWGVEVPENEEDMFIRTITFYVDNDQRAADLEYSEEQ